MNSGPGWQVGLDACTVVFLFGVAARGSGWPAEMAAARLGRRPQLVSDAVMA